MVFKMLACQPDLSAIEQYFSFITNQLQPAYQPLSRTAPGCLCTRWSVYRCIQLLKKRIIWRIDDDESVDIGEDPCLPHVHTGLLSDHSQSQVTIY